ncbi:MAG: tetratricopeptide repeat protein [Candidatus Eremiobacteraeota bacterium]|nr:tetratricopeptide repeat protein [Candidatus Eremiobacteraeota bacterium]
MRSQTAIIIAACALAALAAWPFALARQTARASLPLPTPAPVTADYRYRNSIVADLERLGRRHPDQLDEQMLAAQYLQRYREAPDVGDVLRAVAAAQRSLHYQARYNVGATSALVSAYTALHKFRLARRYARERAEWMPWDSDSLASVASLDMEIGDYAQAGAVLRRAPRPDASPGWETAVARYDELTGDLPDARALIARASSMLDSRVNEPAEIRAWYHWRAGELAFASGDLRSAELEYKIALTIFPDYWHANNGLARLYWAQRRWGDALAAADKSADVYPLPETLAYKVDAQRALGDVEGARNTQALIEVIERLGNLQGINDRLIAAYYSDHAVRLDHAVDVARRDLRNRDDVYAEDTLAWALAMDGHWSDALPHAERAAALGTQDARLLFHVGMIALHNGRTAEARARLSAALAVNPHFHPFYAEDARAALTSLSAASARSN